MICDSDGRWHIITGNCHDIMPALPDKHVTHVITDPPYTQRTSNNARTAPDGRNGSSLGDAKAYINFAGVDGLETSIATQSLRLANRWVIIFCALEQIWTYAVAAGDAWIRSGVWVRTNNAPQFTGDRPGQGAEGVAIMHRDGKKRWNRGGHPATWVGPTVNAVRDPQRGILGHPTPKPEWLMVDLISAFTDPDDIIMDPFCGSGTTGVAALRLGRRFVGIEIDDAHADMARRRCRAECDGTTLRALSSGQLPLPKPAV